MRAQVLVLLLYLKQARRLCLRFSDLMADPDCGSVTYSYKFGGEITIRSLVG